MEWTGCAAQQALTRDDDGRAPRHRPGANRGRALLTPLRRLLLPARHAAAAGRPAAVHVPRRQRCHGRQRRARLLRRLACCDERHSSAERVAQQRDAAGGVDPPAQRVANGAAAAAVVGVAQPGDGCESVFGKLIHLWRGARSRANARSMTPPMMQSARDSASVREGKRVLSSAARATRRRDVVAADRNAWTKLAGGKCFAP